MAIKQPQENVGKSIPGGRNKRKVLREEPLDMPKRGRKKANMASVPCTRQRPVRDELGALERARY